MEDGDSGQADDSTGEPLPLPRRAGQTHLEPQLREPGSAGWGTPFAAFAPSDDTSAEAHTDDDTELRNGKPTADGEAPDDTAAGGPDRAGSGEHVAAFRAAARRASRRRRR